MGISYRHGLSWRWFGLLAVAFALAVLSLLPVAAADDDTAAISQGFSTDGEVTPGSLVSLADASKSGVVKAANTENVERLIGVVSKKPLVELSGEAGQTQVVIGGTVLALVSNINGEVKYGDKITASPVSGVGMKATESGQVLGTASLAFSDAKEVSERSIRDRDGSEKTIKIGLLPLQVNVSFYQVPDENKTILPEFLQQFLNAIAGKEVSLMRSLLSLALLIAGFGSAAVLLYSSVRSSIISIGRNPLSAQAVHRSLFQVGGISIGILLVMLIAVYLVLVI